MEMAFDKSEAADPPADGRLKPWQIAAAYPARQRDMGNPARPAMAIGRKAGGGQFAVERFEQSAQGRRRLAATGPEYAALGPETEAIEAQLKGLGTNTVPNAAQGIALGAGNGADESQGQVQRRRSHDAATARGQGMAQRGQVRCGFRVRPEGEEDAMRTGFFQFSGNPAAAAPPPGWRCLRRAPRIPGARWSCP